MEEFKDTIEALLEEERKFAPPEQFKSKANLKDPGIYEQASQDPERFWSSFARELNWFKPWDKTLKWSPPWAKWFLNGKINASYNCLDRHIETSCKNKAAIIWEGEPKDTRVLTYFELYRETNKFANVLKDAGVKRGDIVTLYLPMIPELPVAMLACARIGAPHSVVFAGFSPEALRERMRDAQSRFLVTCDGYYRRGKKLNLKQDADRALKKLPETQKVVVVKRTGQDTTLTPGRDFWWDELMEDAEASCEPEVMDAEDTLFLMYTSGTTGKPKGVVHTTAGYLVGAYTTTKLVFDIKEEDTYWCCADVGWITGHTYIVYGPLLCGTTTLIYEGAPDYPEKDRLWEMVEKYGVNIFYTAPTAIRSFKQWGKRWPKRHDLSTLRLLGTVGEPINPEAWMWYHKHVGGERCPIVDTWWQTETGHILITPLPGITATKPGSTTKPFPGIKASILDEKGKPVPPGKGGYLAIEHPWPGMLRTIHGDPDRYVRTYWSKWKGSAYFTGDGARVDEEGDFWILGRVDDVMNVSGHRLSTMEIESALVAHEAVAEAAVVGRRHEVKGEVPLAFLILEEGFGPSGELKEGLVGQVVEMIGPIAKPVDIIFCVDLPKTRSGKIMRRLLKDIANGEKLGDITTLRNPKVATELEARLKRSFHSSESPHKRKEK